MEYKLEYLPSAALDIMEIEASLYEFNHAASDKFANEIEKKTSDLTRHPFMYQVCEEDDFFRSVPLCYNYRLFYHIAEETKAVKIFRVLRGMMDIGKELQTNAEW